MRTSSEARPTFLFPGWSFSFCLNQSPTWLGIASSCSALLANWPWPKPSSFLLTLPFGSASLFCLFVPTFWHLLWAFAPFPTQHRQLTSVPMHYTAAQTLLDNSELGHLSLLYKNIWKESFHCSEALKRQNGRVVKREPRLWNYPAWFWILAPLHTNSWVSYWPCLCLSFVTYKMRVIIVTTS